MIPVDPCFNSDMTRIAIRFIYLVSYACDLKSTMICLIVSHMTGNIMERLWSLETSRFGQSVVNLLAMLIGTVCVFFISTYIVGIQKKLRM